MKLVENTEITPIGKVLWETASGEHKIMKIKGVPGITERPDNYGPFDLPAAHVFKISDGKIASIEAIGYIAPHGIKNGWE